MPDFARIAINIPQIGELFDYKIPAELQTLLPGSLVTVPFGKQTVQGIVTGLVEEPAVPEVKSIERLVDEKPVCTLKQIELAQWMARENLSTVSECLEQMLPPGLSQHSDILLHLNGAFDQNTVTPLQKRILGALSARGDLRGRQMDAALPKVNWRASMQGLVNQGIVTTRPILSTPSIRPRTVRNCSLMVSPEYAIGQIQAASKKNSPTITRRQNIIQLLERENGAVDVAIVYAETGANSGDIKFLADLDLISLGESEVWRDPLAKLPDTLFAAPILSPAQSTVWRIIEDQIIGTVKKKPNLLVGVTGSGKTEIYLRAVEAVLKQNKGVLVLVPEIALTPQTARRFYARFPGKVGLIHSRLSPGERYDTWRRIRSGALPVVVGARSALFAPIPSLGMIIIDECHEESYYQDDFHPHYSAVETALAYAKLTDAVILLGSATPTVEQLHRFRQNKWYELSLPDRILAHGTAAPDAGLNVPGVLPLPKVQVVDMREELKSGNRSVLSRALYSSIDEALGRNEQVILFLNRRGSASYVFCRDCGYVLRCPRCNTQLTFHEFENALVCHICNYRRKMPSVCPECKGPNIRQFGLGTESLEKTINEQFPSARVLRWDADTTRYKGAHDLILDHFSQHRADILVGTKMLAKGLDLPLVTLVGAVLADASLNLPDFHAAERTFELLSQVAGRAGRSGLGGKAIFQTFAPEHYAIQNASLHDLEGFYQREIELRKKTGYPPFSRLLRIEFSQFREENVIQSAQQMGERLLEWQKGKQDIELIGPVPCFYSKMAGKYRWQILLKGVDPKRVLENHPLATWQLKEVDVEIMVDPPSLL